MSLKKGIFKVCCWNPVRIQDFWNGGSYIVCMKVCVRISWSIPWNNFAEKYRIGSNVSFIAELRSGYPQCSITIRHSEYTDSWCCRRTHHCHRLHPLLQVLRQEKTWAFKVRYSFINEALEGFRDIEILAKNLKG